MTAHWARVGLTTTASINGGQTTRMRLHYLRHQGIGISSEAAYDSQPTNNQETVAMNEPQLFNASFAKNAVYKPGLRSFMEYRDLGIERATHGKFRAHVIRIKKDAGGVHDLHTTGLHKHLCDFQMFYVLKGWIKFIYEGEGEHTFQAGDCVLQPAGIVHNELDCSDDLEVLEIYSPAVHETVALNKLSAAAD
jgi:mannose-6-phosphate isomerase-like protein (cupin superfamily)